MGPVAIDREILRNCLLESLRRKPQTQYENLKYEVAEVARERGLPVQNISRGQAYVEQSDHRRLRELIWALIVEGVVTVGMNDSDPAWPFLSLSELGEDFVKGNRASPYEDADYVQRIESVAPFDPVEEVYVREALEAFRRGLPNAAAVMIGAASEQLLILTLGEIALRDPAAKPKAAKVLDGPALGMVRFAQDHFEKGAMKLPRELREQLPTTFAGIASLIRVTRNDGGHPALPGVDRGRCFVALQLFPEYLAASGMAAYPAAARGCLR